MHGTQAFKIINQQNILIITNNTHFEKLYLYYSAITYNIHDTFSKL